jgi:hypothetical protein
MTHYVQTPGDRIDNLAHDVLVAGYLARDRKLTPEAADQLAVRVKAAAADMIVPGDIDLLRTAAERLQTLSVRVKAGNDFAKVARSKVEPTQAELAAEWDRQAMERW